ncbi:BRISC and BRCA1-A complex member 1 [Microtus ochrogaster]|uniref:BRISC and BRCA1-A complex member 1 n=1 Tax=Microtus ochrogaster TaxID=79684 RepID=A0A8J6G348_MICOH|nr:BRISC and BRCA1-A complex member 1 [Microtus ochrogaster]
MEVAEANSPTEEEEEEEEEGEELTPEPRPHTRSNPEGAEDRALGAQTNVGSRSEGEGEAASADDGAASVPGAGPKPWQVPAPAPEVQIRTPRVNCPEKVIICLDLSEEMSVPKLESFNGSRTNALNVSQKMVEMFVRTKHKIDKSHEFALVVVNDDPAWLSGLTSDPRELCSCLYDLETAQQKTELPVTENVQTIPPPYVVRTILVYSRPPCQSQFSLTEPMKKMLQCPYFFFDIVCIHNGTEEKEDERRWKFEAESLVAKVATLLAPEFWSSHPAGECTGMKDISYCIQLSMCFGFELEPKRLPSRYFTHRAPSRQHFGLLGCPSPGCPDVFSFMGSLDTKGTSYKYEVALAGPALELHNCMAKLLAHPLQRPCQTHASYSLLEDEEAGEGEATV